MGIGVGLSLFPMNKTNVGNLNPHPLAIMTHRGSLLQGLGLPLNPKPGFRPWAVRARGIKTTIKFGGLWLLLSLENAEGLCLLCSLRCWYTENLSKNVCSTITLSRFPLRIQVPNNHLLTQILY